MKADPISREIESVKDHFDAQAEGDLQRFFHDMDGWLKEHPHVGAVVSSPAELEARLRQREATEPPTPSLEPYRVYDPIIADIHRSREKLDRGQSNQPLMLKDERTRSEKP